MIFPLLYDIIKTIIPMEVLLWNISKQLKQRTFATALKKAVAANARHLASLLAKQAAVLLTRSAKAKANNLT